MTPGTWRDETGARSFRGFVPHVDESGQTDSGVWQKPRQVKTRAEHLLIRVAHLGGTNVLPFPHLVNI